MVWVVVGAGSHVSLVSESAGSGRPVQAGLDVGAGVAGSGGDEGDSGDRYDERGRAGVVSAVLGVVLGDVDGQGALPGDGAVFGGRCCLTGRCMRNRGLPTGVCLLVA